MKEKLPAPWPAFESGQIWRMDEITCHIGDVGKRLVHYKMFKGKPVRVPSKLGTKETLVKHLQAKKAVLLPA